MPGTITKRFACWVSLGLVSAFFTGCGGSSGYDRYTPSSSNARAALEAALTSWQQGQPHGKVEGATRPVEVADFRWLAGRKLASFIIEEEQPGEEGPVWFAVRLRLREPEDETVVRYAIMGNDPLWVFTDEDYAKLKG